MFKKKCKVEEAKVIDIPVEGTETENVEVKPKKRNIKKLLIGGGVICGIIAAIALAARKSSDSADLEDFDFDEEDSDKDDDDEDSETTSE